MREVGLAALPLPSTVSSPPPLCTQSVFNERVSSASIRSESLESFDAIFDAAQLFIIEGLEFSAKRRCRDLTCQRRKETHDVRTVCHFVISGVLTTTPFQVSFESVLIITESIQNLGSRFLKQRSNECSFVIRR